MSMVDVVDRRRLVLDGSVGGTCTQCCRIFKSDEDLNNHRKYCSYFLSQEARKAGHHEEEPVDEPWLDGTFGEYLSRSYADLCLSYLNKRDSHEEYMLVKPGNYAGTKIAAGHLFHFTFKAKTIDCPVQTFFAQFRTFTNRPPMVDFCVILGYSEDLPPWRSADLGGCRICSFGIHHPSPNMVGCSKLILGKY